MGSKIDVNFKKAKIKTYGVFFIILMILEVSGVEHWSTNKSQIDPKIHSKMECILATIFERCWWILGCKLGPKINQHLSQEGIEKTIQTQRLGLPLGGVRPQRGHGRAMAAGGLADPN